MRLKLTCSTVAIATLWSAAAAAQSSETFNRIATFPVASNLPSDRDPATPTVAEIVAASEDGMTLVYTDSQLKALGVVDIADPKAPKPAGFVALEGEPTSVAVANGKALVAVVTSESNDKPSGQLVVVDIASKAVESTCELGGQPDAVAFNPDKSRLAVVLENERDEELNDGELPQLPSGALAILSVDSGAADCASMRTVDLAGLADVAGDDAEPEFADVNGAGEAVVTLQENNHIAIVDLAAGTVKADFSAGAADLEGIDTKEDGIIRPTDKLEGVAREPDAVQWLDDERFVTANEGDYKGGSRSFTIFNRSGEVLYDSGAELEHLAMRIGHYPEGRSDAKGTEPEGLEVATFGDDRLIFVGTERSSFVAVYRDTGAEPEYLQVLPAGLGPEGLTAIPSRSLFVVASEEDLVEDGGARSTLMIYERGTGDAAYPTLVSSEAEGAPIGWGALSGLAADTAQAGRL
nr:alkaline phosphatase [Hyphomicrobiales bacterium]